MTTAPFTIRLPRLQIEALADVPTPRSRHAAVSPLLEWRKDADNYLDELVRLDGCNDCLDNRSHCRLCAVGPLSWCCITLNGVTLKSLGLRVQLGHEPRDVCPRPKPGSEDDFVLLDTADVIEVGVDFCGCVRALPYHVQLLRMRWYPAASVNPKTGATFRLLDRYQLLSA
ncbi:hypothetical protein TRAPUB_13593 [Trametes pubescens]|uniref:CxC2-like cysteine cluster KDZ transposase-associated domain-containing protein n=1 Tax=Trametes pubescens TaxID=154538 RepID=A0A1M2VQT3_TRAPU|nr:hypothetical protein TRAPUB_13593 [Trametes pubescens]